MSLSEAIQKVFDFLSEYRQESATLPVSEQQMDTFEEMFSGREVKSSRIKQRCILDPSGYVNRGFTAVSKRKKKEKILLDPIALKDTVCHPECHYILCLRSAYMNWPTVSEVVSFWHQVLTFSHQVLKKKNNLIFAPSLVTFSH